ncbi:MAG: hypothetical protein Q4C10_15010, partial [Clostridia bacterium]|nr:hypothetical protein [Clostridia bacterium]
QSQESHLMEEKQVGFLLAALAAPAKCGHLRPGKLPFLQACRLALQAFSSICQSVDFVNILKERNAGKAFRSLSV